jgi:hypothetical protein
MPPAEAFVRSWEAAWNARDLEAVLAHFDDDATFASPFAARLMGGSGRLRGIDEIRAYWTRGLELLPGLRFEVERWFGGVDVIVIQYRNQAGDVVDEVLIFEGDRVVAGYGTYPPD